MKTPPNTKTFSSSCMTSLIMCHIRKWQGLSSHLGYVDITSTALEALSHLFEGKWRRRGLGSGQPTASGCHSLLLAQLHARGVLGRRAVE